MPELDPRLICCTSVPLLLVMFTATLLVPVGACTAPAIDWPAVYCAELAWVSTECPTRLTLDRAWFESRVELKLDSELCIESIPETVPNCASWVTNVDGSSGCVGSWFFSCAVINDRKSLTLSADIEAAVAAAAVLLLLLAEFVWPLLFTLGIDMRLLQIR